MLFRDMTESAIQKALRDDRAAENKARNAETRELIDMYEGGARMKPYLLRRPGESMATASASRQERYTYRANRAHNPNYFSRLTDSLADGFVGDKITRRVSSGDEAFQALLDDVHIQLVQQEYGLGTVLVGGSLVGIVGWAEGGISLCPLHPFAWRVKSDPQDPYALAEVEEDRTYQSADGKEHTVTWVWNSEWGRLYDSDGVRLTVDPMTGLETDWADPNPYDGEIPYVYWRGRPVLGQFEGISYVRDQASLQKELYNRSNDLMILCHMRSFGVPVFKDLQTNIADWSEYGGLEVGPTGDAWMLEPSGDIPGMVMTLEKLIEWMYETGNVPTSMVQDASVKSGVALAIEWMPFLRVIQTLRNNGAVSERELVRKMLVIGKAHGVEKLPSADVDIEIEYEESVLPTDETADFKRDLLMLNNDPPLITREEFVRRWHKLPDDKAVAKYIAELDAEADAAAAKKKEQQPEPQPFGAFGGLQL